ncbi:MAG: metallophosphoesterase family protein [Marinilabiliales bacterium]|nr:metallophosphoesterase family protein [Marinilabiliales bacterium]
MINKYLYSLTILVLLSLSAIGGNNQADRHVKSVMDRVIADLYKNSDKIDLMKLDGANILDLFTPEEKEILATTHQILHVNVPVIVSVMQNRSQKRVPFWLPQKGFTKTSLSMNNTQTTYDVWQKKFPAGDIGLGVDGFENGLALHYFVSVRPVNQGDQLKVIPVFPADQKMAVLDNGTSTYLDWDELVLKNVPEEMKGELLFRTTRGRSAESHLVGAFRRTPSPSTADPDQIILTWSGDPSTTVDVQWRTNPATIADQITFREKGGNETKSVKAQMLKMEDRMLMNDRYTLHYTAQISGLKPGKTYQYKITGQANWLEKQTFQTAAKDARFSFLWFGDTHFSPTFGEILKKADAEHPDAAFFSIVGDLVSDGLNRDQWDALFSYTKETSCRIPFMSVPGNHDNRAGLGAKLYCDLFSYPLNAPAGVPKKQTYSFTYKNTLFLMIDATSPIDAQSAWIEKELAASKATWKIAMFHFAPYNWEEPYLDIQAAWIPIFDKYHVDMVYGGHLHYYMRSKPMRGGKIVPNSKEGTLYMISVGIPNHDHNLPEEPYAEVRNAAGHLYQYVKIDGQTLHLEAVNRQGTMIDSFTLQK